MRSWTGKKLRFEEATKLTLLIKTFLFWQTFIFQKKNVSSENSQVCFREGEEGEEVYVFPSAFKSNRQERCSHCVSRDWVIGNWIKKIIKKGSGEGCPCGLFYRCDLSVTCWLLISGLSWKALWSRGFFSSVTVQPLVQKRAVLTGGSGQALPEPTVPVSVPSGQALPAPSWTPTESLKETALFVGLVEVGLGCKLYQLQSWNRS